MNVLVPMTMRELANLLTPQRFAVYTGPTLVEPVAQRLRDAGVTVTCEGTMHVHVETDKTEADLLTILGPTWNQRDVRYLGQARLT